MMELNGCASEINGQILRIFCGWDFVFVFFWLQFLFQLRAEANNPIHYIFTNTKL